MEKYAYRGYIITGMPNGYCIVHGITFESYDDACDWVDVQLDEPLTTNPNPVPELHLYHIFYVTRGYDRGYDEYIYAYTPKEAEKYLRRHHRDVAYIADINEVD